MEKEKAKYLLNKVQDSIDSTRISKVKTDLEALPDSAFEPLSDLKLKSKTVTILLSIFLGGICAARFYLGDIKFGIFKILATIGLSVLSIVLSLVAGIGIFGIIISILIFVWWVLEIILCYSRVKTVNSIKLEDMINAYKGKA